MGMTIDESIENLVLLKKLEDSLGNISGNTNSVASQSFGCAIDTMRKYQKIEDLVNDCADESVDDTSCCARYIGLIEEIIYTEKQEDGNDD